MNVFCLNWLCISKEVTISIEITSRFFNEIYFYYYFCNSQAIWPILKTNDFVITSLIFTISEMETIATATQKHLCSIVSLEKHKFSEIIQRPNWIPFKSQFAGHRKCTAKSPSNMVERLLEYLKKLVSWANSV